MKLVKDATLEQLGGKAYHLLKMKQANLPVPDFAVYSFDCFQDPAVQDYLYSLENDYHSGKIDLLGLSETLSEWAKAVVKMESIEPLEDWVCQQAATGHTFSLRSSATVEDGSQNSFAGQFTSQLNLQPADFADALEKILLSLYTVSTLTYLFEQGLALHQAEMICILQIMVIGQRSGIYFTANPKGILNEHIIVLGEGLGDNIVEDKVATTMITVHPRDQLFYAETVDKAPTLSNKELEKLQDLAQRVTNLFSPYMDMEFTIRGEDIYLLQARPITTLPKGEKTILDNSNIVESYPGISSPLTISFIQEAYTGIFRSLAGRLVGANAPELEAYEPTFQNMIQAVNGRVYYQIKSWYQLLQLLPFSTKIIPIWQDMLGVRETDIPQMPVHLPVMKRLKIMVNVLKEFRTAPQQMKVLEEQFIAIQQLFQQQFSPDADSEVLIHLIFRLKDDILAHWDITLINDLYAFVYTGLLKKLYPRGAVQAEIAGIEQIESMRPALALQELVTTLQLPTNNALKEALVIEDASTFLARQELLVQSIREFIEEFGDRAPEELKLETATFRTHPERLLALLYELAQQDKNTIEVKEKEKRQLSGNRWVAFLRKRAMLGVKYRESSRLNRTRIYGMMRQIFRALGQQFLDKGLLQEVDDIFYLTMDEVISLAQKPENMQQVIDERKAKASQYQALPAFSRYIFLGQVFEKHLSGQTVMNQYGVSEQRLQGIGCSAGVVRGQVLLVDDVQSVGSPLGKIIVTKMTDPGWVYLLTQAKGIIAEQGSLLSHTAIISRELGVPSVVNVAGVTSLLKTGDWLELNGLSGEIRRLEGEFDV